MSSRRRVGRRRPWSSTSTARSSTASETATGWPSNDAFATLGLRHLPRGTFAAVVTATEVPELKPHPAACLAVLAALKVPAHRAVAVEDSANGVAAATAAGLACCLAVRNDYTRDDDLSGACMVLDSFAGASGADVLALADHHGAPETRITSGAAARWP